jgi:signal transduction histidine kinase
MSSTILTGDSVAPTLAGSWLRLARFGWLAVALAGAAILVTSMPSYGLKMTGQLSHATGEMREVADANVVVFGVLSGIASLMSVLLSLGLAVTFYLRRFEEPAAAALSFYLLVYAVVMAGPIEGWSLYWTGNMDLALKLQALLLATPSVAMFLLFPNGQFVPRWSRWVLILTIPWNATLFFLPAFDVNTIASLPPLQIALLSLWFSSFLGLGLYSQIYRYRRVSTAVERQQTKWVVFGFGLWFVYMLISTVPYVTIGSLPADAPVPWWVPASEMGWFLSLNIVPVTLAIAVTRYRLWEINLFVNRALVYGALSVCIVAIYVLMVGAVGTLLQAQESSAIAFMATGLVAVLFNPLRERLQRWVNRFLYGQRDEPFEVMAHLGQRLEATLAPEMIYPVIVETVAQTLKLPYAALAVREEDRFVTVESFGKPGGELIAYPLTYQSEIVGELLVEQRAEHEAFSEADERLLQSIAAQAGTAVHALQLTADLQRSRQRLVAAREEERRRLRRDLHDGLGPRLAAQMLKIGTSRSLLERDPVSAGQLLTELENDTEETLAEIRRFVYDLRPPALDQLGLVGAIEAFVSNIDGQTAVEVQHSSREDGPIITIDGPEKLDALPAAIEVAAYRIALEGLTNVWRHAQARRCRLSLAIDNGSGSRGKQLQLEIVDDGVGMPAQSRAGVGLTSMKERAEEIGGMLRIEPAPGGGTRLAVELPMPAAE